VITLSADDPASFATTLADEYAYAWAGLVFGAQQQAPSYAQEWLEMAAKSSRRAVF
jgi:adenosine deaminase